MTFEAWILGPVEASMDGRAVSLGSPKQRAVFALLVLTPGRVVSTERLLFELWGADPPSTAVSTLQVYISRLRRSIGAQDGEGARASVDGHGAAPVQLLRRAPGYQLNVAEESVDAYRFASLVTAARAQLDHDPRAAEKVLDQALALQRGPALADVVRLLGPTAAAEAQRLDDLRLVALEARLKVQLAQGEAAAAAAEAAALIREYPLQEDLHAMLMLALYRAGRQAEALAAFEAVRDELDRELGLDPGAPLRALHLQILRHDPALDAVPLGRDQHGDPPPESTLERRESVPSLARGAATGRVPESWTSLVGRDDEIQALLQAIAGGRLTALVGTGGAGKTRLALAVTEHARVANGWAVWWVDVASVTEPVSLPRIVAAALGSREQSARSALDSAIAHLGGSPGLLVLDNCEHLVADCAQVVLRLLVGCPQVRVLVTTREPLGLPGELVWPVLPLALPPGRRAASRADLEASPAIQLWCERAAAALPGFALTDDNAGLVARICTRLDGLPLAIELAAARLRVLSLEDIADALDHQLEVLTSVDRGAPDRHRTLRATLDWSFRLLPPDEQRLLAELSTFQGGFILEAVSAVRTPDPAGRTTLELVARLIDRSLVGIVDRGKPTRYRLLETVRLYAAEELSAAGAMAAASERHLHYFVWLAEQAEPHLDGAGQRQWLNRLDAEVANFIAALRWSVGSRQAVEEGLRLVSALWRFWYLRGHYTAGRDWLELALEAAPDAPAEHRAKALAAVGKLAYLQCAYAVAQERLSAALQIYESRQDGLGVAAVLQSLGCVARELGDYERSRTLHRDSMARWLAAGRADGVARAANYLAFVDWLAADLDEARGRSGEAMVYFRTSGDGEGFAWSLILQGASACYAGDLGGATAWLEESQRRSEQIGYREGIAWSLNQLGVVACRSDDHARARTLLRASLREHWELGDQWRTASVLEALAGTEARTGDPHWAARLLGGATELRTRLRAPIPPVERPDLEDALSRLRSALGAGALASTMAAAGVAELDHIVRAALVEPP